MRILFMGTPTFAVPSLRALVEAGHTLCGVFSQPDKPVGRHQNKLQPTPVKEYALTQDLPVYQPVKLRDGTAMEIIRNCAPELIVVAAYGRILPDEILAYPPKGCINVHSSLLPKYRGAAPINWSILNGDAVTGVTIMDMVHDLDAGDMIRQVTTEIGENETAPELFDRLAVLGAQALVETVADIEAGRAQRTPQDHAAATLAPMLTKELSPLDWSKEAKALHDQVRGLLPWPAATASFAGIRCKVFSTVTDSGDSTATPGAVLEAGKKGIVVACGNGTALRVLELQPDGGKRMPAQSFLAGHPIAVGSVLA